MAKKRLDYATIYTLLQSSSVEEVAADTVGISHSRRQSTSTTSKMVTYQELKEGRTLVEGDKLILHGLEYCVDRTYSGFFLAKIGGGNDAVFKKLGRDDKDVWAKKFGTVKGMGIFPQFENLPDLTKFVIDIYETPEFKSGDWITISPLDGDYEPVVATATMRESKGMTFQVKSVDNRCDTPQHDGNDSGDPHAYTLDGITFYWTSQMIRKATDDEIRKAKEVKFLSDPIKPAPSPLVGLEAMPEKLKGDIGSATILPRPVLPSVQWWEEPPAPDNDAEIRLPKDDISTHIKL